MHMNPYLLSSEFLYLLILPISSKPYPNYVKIVRSNSVACFSDKIARCFILLNKNLEMACFDTVGHQMKIVKALSMKYWSGN